MESFSLLSSDHAYDVTVIGAGPVGCAAALAHAEQNANVLLLEARDGAPQRLAGEWLHPTGLRVLERLGVSPLTSASTLPAGRGFVVFPEDGSEPILLDYPDADQGLSYEHSGIVTSLWEAAASHPHIHFQSSARVTELEQARLRVEQKGLSEAQEVEARRIVGADGRSSVTRKTMGLPDDRHLLSYTAGVLLEDVELPYEGYGHVLLGGLGPVLMYRVGTDVVRMCIDVPTMYVKAPHKAAFLWDSYAPVLPESLRAAFYKALRERPIFWAANQFRPRVHFGQEGIALVGDAAGHFHPLTAMGMTMGFLDADCLSNSDSIEAYQRQRLSECRVPQLLSHALYEVLSAHDDEALEVRQAVYALWRRNPSERKRTMNLLSGGDTKLHSFSTAFLKVLGIATQRILHKGWMQRQWWHQTTVLAQLGKRLGWLGYEALPSLTQGLDVHPRIGLFFSKSQDTPMREKLRSVKRHHTRDSIDASAALDKATQTFLGMQQDNGAWEGEVVWCAMLGAQYALTHILMDRPISDETRKGLLLDFRLTQRENGGWGLHDCSPSTLFTTALVYVASRWLGEPADSAMMTRAREWIRGEGGLVSIPTWGKFWMAMMGLYKWEGLNPLLPELWALPSWLPVHPTRFYCHTRLIYAAMASLYAQRPEAPDSPLVQELRQELYLEDYDKLSFARLAGRLRDAEVVAPPTPILKMAYQLCHLVERFHSSSLRETMLQKLLGEIRFDMETTGLRSISPVSGLLNMLSLHTNDPQDPLLDEAWNNFESWVWRDQAGVRVAGAKSDIWDTSFSVQALQQQPMQPSTEKAMEEALAFLRSRQVQTEIPEITEHARLPRRGGFGFGTDWHNWPVSDCTAEALIAMLSKPEQATPRLREASLDGVRFLLQTQNKDGGFGSYERQKSTWTLDWMNPAEMFGNSMTERSYVECTASSLKAVSLFQKRYPDLLSAQVSEVLRRGEHWLRSQQLSSGAWRGSWAVNFLYGTWFGIEGLRACGAPNTDRAIWKACQWVVEQQREEGGWGEHHDSCVTGEYIALDHSQVIQTSWALLCLLRGGSHEWDAIERGARYLVEQLQEDGHWPTQEPAGVFFQSALLDYKLYKSYFPLWALGMYEERRKLRIELEEDKTNSRKRTLQA